MTLTGLLGPTPIVIMWRSVGCSLCNCTRGHLSGVTVGSAAGDEAFVISVVVIGSVSDAWVLTLHVFVHVLMAAMTSRVGYGLELGPVVDSSDLDGRCHCHGRHLGLGSMLCSVSLSMASTRTIGSLAARYSTAHCRGSASVVFVLCFDCSQLCWCLFLLILRVRALLALVLSVIGSCLAHHACVYLVVAYNILLDLWVVLILWAELVDFGLEF